MKNLALTRLAGLLLCCYCSMSTTAQSISGVVNAYYRVTAVNTPTNGLSLSNAAGLMPGTRVMIIQMKGATIDNSNTASFGDITAGNIGEAGSYEFNYICAVAGNDVLLRYQLTRPYSASGHLQLISIPQYNIVTVSDTIKAVSWDAATGTGGVVVLEADTLYLNSAINVSGQGFAGGAFVNFATPTYNCSWATNVTNYFLQAGPVPDLNYSGGPKGEGIAEFITNAEYGRGKQANGGGGGNNHNTGGAGGANYGAGGNGGRRSNETFFLCHGTNPGIGGLSIASFGYSTGNNRIFMGGGGGCSHQNNAKGTPGGNGGGIVLITANVMIGTGSGIFADGLSSVNLTNVDPYTAEGDGGGGAGAGGSIILNVNEVIGTIDALAKGARGSDASRGVNDCTGPGGGGGGGVVWMKGSSFSPNIAADVTGGSNGVISALSSIAACVGQANGATAGDNGSAIIDYLPPAMGSFLCAPLALTELKFFKGRMEQKNVLIWWTMIRIDNISTYDLERSIDQVNYKSIARKPNNGDYVLTVTDSENFAGTAYYRLKLTRANGTVGYSGIIPITKNLSAEFGRLNISPNPAVHELKINVSVRKNISALVDIFNSSGQRVYHHQYRLTIGHTAIRIPVKHLSPGVYWLLIEANGFRERQKFIRFD